LGENPRPAQAKQLDQELYRLRDGEYRIVYALFDQDGIVYIGKVERRSEKTYRDIAQLLERTTRLFDSWPGYGAGGPTSLATPQANQLTELLL
jgi:hypothetical protein